MTASQAASATLFALICLQLALTPGPAPAQIHWIEAPEFVAPPHAVPEFGDLDGDGDFDLLYPLPLHSYENVGTAVFPIWELHDAFVEGLPALDYGAACLADLDADGDLDFSGGNYFGGSLYYYENVGTPQDPEWQQHNEVYPDLGGYSAKNPELADLDGDGDLDLLVSHLSRFFLSYRNVGSPDSPAWEEDQSLCSGIEMPGGSGDPSFEDVDSDGDLDLVVGDTYACWDITAFENVGTQHEPLWVENLDLLLGVDTDVLGFGLDLADLDGDGAPDLLSIYYAQSDLYTFYLNRGSVTTVEPASWSAIKAMFR